MYTNGSTATEFGSTEACAAPVCSAAFGIFPRIDNALDFAHRSRVLLLRHAASAIDLDVILGGLSFGNNTMTTKTTIALVDLAEKGADSG